MTLKSFNTLSGSNYKTWEEAYLNAKEMSLIPIFSEIPYYIYSKRLFSEDCLRSAKDSLLWDFVSCTQLLSEDFIREFQDKVNWKLICRYQRLSESFIEEFQDKIDWYNISNHQILSESFIEKYADSLDWLSLLISQDLSFDFLSQYRLKISEENWLIFQKSGGQLARTIRYCDVGPILHNAAKYQGICLNPLYKALADDCWLNKSTEFKKQQVIKTHLYKCYDNYFIAYKRVLLTRYSLHTPRYQYLPGHIYESWCDTSYNPDGFGLSVWTKEDILYCCTDPIIKVKIRYEDVGRVDHNRGKIRCFKFEVLN